MFVQQVFTVALVQAGLGRRADGGETSFLNFDPKGS